MYHVLAILIFVSLNYAIGISGAKLLLSVFHWSAMMEWLIYQCLIQRTLSVYLAIVWHRVLKTVPMELKAFSVALMDILTITLASGIVLMFRYINFQYNLIHLVQNHNQSTFPCMYNMRNLGLVVCAYL